MLYENTICRIFRMQRVKRILQIYRIKNTDKKQVTKCLSGLNGHTFVISIKPRKGIQKI